MKRRQFRLTLEPTADDAVRLAQLSRDAMIRFCEEMNPQAIRDILPVGTPKEIASAKPER